MSREGDIPLVTVLTTAYNAERYLAAAIESIRAQTFQDWEYVIVDDGSNDGTASILESYERRDPRIRVIRLHERGGVYSAANEGFRQARGRYVARLDADDTSVVHRLERQLSFLAENPSLRACATDVDILVDDDRQELRGDALPVLPAALKWRACVREMPFPSTTLIERSAWEDVGGFRELPLSQDLRMWCDLSRRGWLGVLPEPLVVWRRHMAQLSSVHGGGQQEDLAHDVLLDHIRALDPSGGWTAQDVYRLRWAAFRPVGLRGGRRVLRRFDALWRSDASLDAHGRREMAELMRWLRLRQLRLWVRTALASRGWGRLIMRVRTLARGS